MSQERIDALYGTQMTSAANHVSTDTPTQSIDFIALGERLRAYRLAANLRSEDVAEQLDLSRAAVYRLERGEIVKIATLERLAKLLGVTLASLLGIETEYHSSVLSYFERMRQLESRSIRVVSHFDPISYLLTSPEYDRYLRLMLEESLPDWLSGNQWQSIIDNVLGILHERKAAFSHRHPGVISLIGLRQIEQFLHHGLVGRLNLPPGVQLERKMAARGEIARIIELMSSDPMGIQIGIVSDNMPSETFQIFEDHSSRHVAVSPFRLGDFPNIRTGIATISTSSDAIALYQGMVDRLWEQAAKGKDGVLLLQGALGRC